MRDTDATGDSHPSRLAKILCGGGLLEIRNGKQMKTYKTQKQGLAKSNQLLAEALYKLEGSIPPKGGATDRLCKRIKRYLSAEAKRATGHSVSSK